MRLKTIQRALLLFALAIIAVVSMLGSELLTTNYIAQASNTPQEGTGSVEDGTGAIRIMASSHKEPGNNLSNFGGLSENGTAAYMGIGTATPERILHLVGNVALFERNVNSAGFIIKRTSANRWVFGVDDPAGFVIKTYPEGSGSTSRLVIDTSGNVGIGTTGPTAKLDVRTDVGNGVYANTHTYSDSDKGVYGISYYGKGVYGENGNMGNFGYLGGSNEGVYGKYYNMNNFGRLGTASSGVYGSSDTAYAGRFVGKVLIDGSLATGFNATTTDYTITANDSILTVDASGGDVTITLPTANAIGGRAYTIKRVDDTITLVVIDANGDETIDGKANYNLEAQWKYVTVVSNGTNWLITANN